MITLEKYGSICQREELMFLTLSNSLELWLKRALANPLNVLEQIMEENLLLRNLIIIARMKGSKGIEPLFTLHSRMVLLNA